MEGLRRKNGEFSVDRGFASSRLERQILVRVYELVLPVIRRSLGGETPIKAESELGTESSHTLQAKGA